MDREYLEEIGRPDDASETIAASRSPQHLGSPPILRSADTARLRGQTPPCSRPRAPVSRASLVHSERSHRSSLHHDHSETCQIAFRNDAQSRVLRTRQCIKG